MVFPLLRTFMALPQGLTFDSAQKAPEVVRDDPCRAAWTASGHQASHSLFTDQGKTQGVPLLKDNCCPWHPAGGTQGCSGAISCCEKHHAQHFFRNFRGISRNFEWHFLPPFLSCFPMSQPSVSCCYATYLPKL